MVPSPSSETFGEQDFSQRLWKFLKRVIWRLKMDKFLSIRSMKRQSCRHNDLILYDAADDGDEWSVLSQRKLSCSCRVTESLGFGGREGHNSDSGRWLVRCCCGPASRVRPAQRGGRGRGYLSRSAPPSPHKLRDKCVADVSQLQLL